MVSGSLNDLSCDDVTVERAATDLIIFVDTAWDYLTIQAFIA